MDQLLHLFDSNVKVFEAPKVFKAARFTSPGSKLEIKEVEWVHPKEGEIVVKVFSVGLHSTDEIVKHGLLPYLKYPITPGSSFAGEVVQTGAGVKHHAYKIGHNVVGVCAHGALAEYAVVNADYVVELKKPELRRFEKEQKELSRDETHRRNDANERLGYHGHGIDVVIGDGGAARIAVQVLKATSVHKVQRIIVITSNDRWNAAFYDVEPSELLLTSHNDLAGALKVIGGIRFAVAVNQPDDAFDQILEAMRYSSELVVLAPNHAHKLHVPLAPIVAKALSIRGAVWPDKVSLEKVLELVDRHALHVSVNRYKFDQEGINKAWEDLEMKTKFDQPVVIVSETIQAQEVTH
ncbi:hypothetical protein JCM5353_008989 [Sporobolomyces roseus]